MDTSHQPTAPQACPGCGSRGAQRSRVRGIWQCDRCGGLISFAPISYNAARQVVHLSEMQADCAEPQYFDLAIRERGTGTTYRTHGWFDPQTKKVVQFG